MSADLRNLPGAVSREGFALPAALAVLVLLSVLVVTVYANAMASFRSGNIDLGKTRSHFAAEAGAEAAMAQLALALQDAVIDDAELAGITPPTIASFTYDSFSVERIGGIVNERITDGPFTGLLSLTQMVDIYSEASDPDNNSSAVVVTAKAQAIPIFQFGVFYEKDLEIDNLPPMYFAGWVHSNGSIWTGPTGSAYYEDIITTPNKYYRDAKAWHVAVPNNRVFIDDASGTAVGVTFDSRSITNANSFRNASNASFDDRLKTDAYNVDSLRVPLPAGVDPIEVILERRFSDGALEQAAKFAWKADWYITVDLGDIDDGTEAVDLCASAISHTRDGGEGVPTAAECALIFRFEYDKWWEERERRWVDVLDVNVDQLQSWATGADSTAIVYIHMLTPGADDPRGDGVFPVVRLHTASSLDYPLTMSTKHPVYTLGNYNSGAWQPAAIIADAVTVLSPAWDDAQHQTTFVHRRSSANSQGSSPQNIGASTSIYAAVLAGHSPSACDHHAGVNNGNCSSSTSVAEYGGGLENFPRFLEDFRTSDSNSSSTRTVTYVGSLVSLFYNRQGSGNWVFGTGTGDSGNRGEYYWPPTRDWSFDTRFEYPENLPPGTPVVGNVIHTAFRPIF